MGHVLTHGTPFHYTIFGLHVASCLPLPAYPATGSEPDVHIYSGRVPESLHQPQAAGVLYQASRDHFLFWHDQVGRYLVRNGKEIVIEAGPRGEPDRLALLLMSSPFGALLHQRELLPLHGSAISVDNQAVVFAGISGAGKSTLAAAFLGKGYPVLTDDISVVSATGGGPPTLCPGYSEVKLWADAAQKVGQPLDELGQMRPGLEKYLLSTPTQFCPNPLPLKRIYLLEVAEEGGLELLPIAGASKVEALSQQTYRRRFLGGMGNRVAHFKLCATVSTHVPVTRVTRPARSFLLDELVSVLQDDFSP